jgi:heat shock protein 4
MTNTITGLKALIGKKFHSDSIQSEIPKVAYRIIDVAGNVGLPVQYRDEEVVLTPERVYAMFLKSLQGIAERSQGAPVPDVVLAVPAYFTDAERRAVLDSAKIVGLNVLKLLNDCTAAALAYGIYKTDLPPDKTTNVAFVDCGAMDTTVAIVAFIKGKLTVLSVATDRHLGGEDFTRVIAEHFAAEWKEKHGIDAHTNKKAWFRLMTAAEKTKIVLSSNPQAPIAIECFMDDIDVKGMMERDLFLELCAPLMAKLQQVVEDAFAGCGITKDDIETVEIVGGSSRVPAVQKTVSEFFGKECSKTLNFDECIAKGCALQCAMLSPAFKVRDFQVNDVTMYPIALSWSSAGAAEAMEVEGEGEVAAPKAGSSSTVVFQKFNSVPNTKMLTFYRKDTFTLSASYDDSVDLPSGFSRALNEFTISDIPQHTDADGKPETTKVKVKLRLDLHGCLSLESAIAVEEEVVVEEEVSGPAKGEAPPAEGEAAPAASAGEAEAAPAEGDAAAAVCDGEAPAPAESEKKKTKKIRRIPVKVKDKALGLSERELMEATESEAQMALQDRIIQETAEAMNKLEATVYSMRDKLGQELAEFSSEEEKAPIMAMLTQLEDWLYEDGMNVDKATYESKYNELMDKCGPIVLREREASLRPDAIAQLKKTIARYQDFVGSSDERYAHIEPEDKAKVAAEVEAAKAWLADVEAKVAASPTSADPVIKAAEIFAKAEGLDSVCDPIMRKPKPPPKVEPAPAKEVPAESPAAEPAAEDAVGESPAPPAAGADMDVD